MALGAQIVAGRALVLGQSLRLAVIGVVIGVVGALAGTRLLQSLLFGVSPTDPLVLAAAAVVLLIVARPGERGAGAARGEDRSGQR